MPEQKNVVGEGSFCWVELATRDTAGAKKFYGGLFHWEQEEHQIPGMGAYTMFQLKKKGVGGLYQLTAEQKKMSVPPNWLSYVHVKNADEMHKKAEKLGARTMMPPMDIPDMGRAVVLADPTGAVFAIWQPKDEHDEALHEHIPGNRCWNELLTSNLDRGVKFYTELFGWKAQVQQMGPMSYTILMRGNDPIGGAMTIDKSWGNVPSNWMVYFVAKSCDEAVAYVKKEKGMVMMPPNDIPEVGRVAVVADPQGAAFGFVQPPPR